jgi:hypothetical protein
MEFLLSQGQLRAEVGEFPESVLSPVTRPASLEERPASTTSECEPERQ